MKACLIIEQIGNYHKNSLLYENVFGRIDSTVLGFKKSNSWVARIHGQSKKFKFKREFLKYQRDYTDANSSGSRGINDTYILESGKVYEVNDHGYRYFCRPSEDGCIIKISEEEVIEWLKRASE